MSRFCGVFIFVAFGIVAIFLQVSRSEYVVPKYLKAKYGAQMGQFEQSPQSGVKTATKTRLPAAGAVGGGSYAGGQNKASKFIGGCMDKPPTPLNSGILCSQYSGCRADCLPNYQFPNGSPQLFITCQNGGWKIEGTDFTMVPNCEPICLPPCLNSGICVAPNQCNCPENYSGPQCQFENKPCLNFPPPPKNSRRTCRSKQCTISCLAGHQFPDGSAITNLICKNGFWVPSKEKWTTVPDCEPTCNPPCQNGGNCLSFNICQCPQDFRGPQCQYSAEACSPKKLPFNGGYKCTGDMDTFSCTLSCPDQIQFEFQPAAAYVCSYSTGIYIPSPIPQCVFPQNSQIISLPGTNEHFYQLGEHPVFNLNSMSVNGIEQFTLPPLPPPQEVDIANVHFVPISNFGNNENQLLTVEQKLPEPGICYTWSGTHYKTFDGRIYSFESKCGHTLVKDSFDTFTILIQNDPNCADCRIIQVYLQDKEYILKQVNGKPVLTSFSKILPIPGQLPGLRAEMSAHYVVLSLDSVGVVIKTHKDVVQVEIKENLWNRTEGLCGTLDGDPHNDPLLKDKRRPLSIAQLAASWKIEDLEEECNDVPTEEHSCDKGGNNEAATRFCKNLMGSNKFAACLKVVDITLLMDACRWDYCSCTKQQPSECACETMDIYVKSCSYQGVTIGSWRDENTCPMKCDGGKIYKPCGPEKGQRVCGSLTEELEEHGACVEGCFCPEGTVLHDNKCISEDECPCRLRGKNFVAGSSVPKECNTCTCSKGKWVCTQVECGARCSAVGDPHYVTFDGKKFDFMGQCSYYLVKSDNFTVEAENVACAGAISEAMNFPTTIAAGLPSCTKAVTIKINGVNIKLKQNHDVIVNGKDIQKLPFKFAGGTIRSSSSIFIVVELTNGVEVWWDGLTRVYIDVPASLKGKTKGLCGTFNNNQKDDFLTPENDVEQAVIPFANKWKTTEKCSDIPDSLKNHPCTVNIHHKPTAEQHCKAIKSPLFELCHWYVDPEPFYQDCLYDMCSCEFKISKCLCPTIAAYAQECALKGVKIDWRADVKECGVHCTGGQTYQVCGNGCSRTCSDISIKPDCKQMCVEGCNCPVGQALNEDGICIPIGQCKCQQDGLEFHAGYKEVRPGSKGQELCTCINALWSCRLATKEEIKKYPAADDLKSLCSSSENMEFTTCEPPEPVTCKNMDSPDYFSATICHAGCKCKDGYVLDTTSRKCVRPTECPCHHGGKSYKENSVVQSDCNTCKCQNGKWNCTDRLCSAECSSWGDSHYKTFDGKHYDFQGQCDYVLSKGSLEAISFDVTIQNVPCGTLGTTCSKSLTIRAKSGNDKETISLSKEKPIPEYETHKHLTLRNKGMFVIVEAPDMGLSIHWDRGTRVYVKVDPRWKNRINGLCGNYNDNQEDDFQTPSGGITEASAKLFGDSWKLQSYCPEAIEINSTCGDRPERKIWALKQCGTLKSPLFRPCHTEVPIDLYFEKCVFDTCACDQGGDCECLCTALAAYAQECNNRGVPIKWRSQQLCPMQCDERCAQYSPCVSTCPSETCDNLLTKNTLSKSCNEDACVEGCAPKPCPPDQVYSNSSYLECVPRNTCKPFCMEIDGVEYNEGDLIEEDDCHSCYCSRENKVCKGKPCSTVQPTAPTTLQMEQIVQCTDGWTVWINQDKQTSKTSKTGARKTDTEPLPTAIIMNNLKGSAKCNTNQIVGIECRTVRDHLTPKQTGLNAECSLERGLVCKGTKAKSCPDFEIRVKCQCAPSSTTVPPVGTTALPTGSTQIPTGGRYVPCDTSRPHQEHPTDCHKFYHCAPGMQGPELMEKTCGEHMMYNPVSMVCDWPNSVIDVKPECGIKATTPKEIDEDLTETEAPECPPRMVKDECAIQCDQMCLFYNYALRERGHCLNDVKCESGCVSAEKKTSCPDGLKWANNQTCVAIHDCLCRSHGGKPVKPGIVFRESECEVCQCIDNFYACDKSNCIATVEPEHVREEVVVNQKPVQVIQITTVTPPKKCDEADYISLIQGNQPLPDSVFTASSSLSSSFLPQYARITSTITETSGGSWSPEYSNLDQYLQVNIGHQEPIYGVTIKGSPLYSEYVTSYKVFYSPDGKTFIPVLNQDNHPQIFRGSVDGTSPVTHIFDKPFEAEAVRINPQTWNNGISLRVELIGCGEPKTTTTVAYEFITRPKPTVQFCDDPMGLSDGLMAPQQILVSSEKSPDFAKSNLAITGDKYWQPLTNSPIEFVEFDFLEPRNITGFVSRGGRDGWVTLFVVRYSQNEKDWSPIVDDGKREREFLGNFNENSPQVTNFVLPINARYFRVIPKKWHKNIQLRLEMHGCYKPYPAVEKQSTPAPSSCNDCPGVASMELEACRCILDKWWDGENCVNRTECPCVIGHMTYPVGSVFEKESCDLCVCKIGGSPYCKPKECEKCDHGLKITVTSTCGCTCLPCPDGTTLCPTSNICINSTLWCNGVQDCPDDEIDCFTTAATRPPTTEKPVKKCPTVECPPGYKVELKKQPAKKEYSSMFSAYNRKTRKTKSSYSFTKNIGNKGVKKPAYSRPKPKEIPVQEAEICQEFRCISQKPPPKFIHGHKECPPANCPPDYIPLFDVEEVVDPNDCPRYTCNPPPPLDAVCNVTGRTFNTFDDVEYKYDICNHVLARDIDGEWDVSLDASCSNSTSQLCRKLVVKHQDSALVFHPDLTLEFDGYKYTVEQTKKIGSDSQAFSISRLGDTLLFVSNRYGMWIIWDKQANVKIGVVRKLSGKVDGLCGYFNENPDDDKRKPDGALARTTVDFGDSWGQSQQCEIKTCPLSIQNKAWEMCNKVKEQVLAPCSREVDIEAFISRCLETTCTCLEASATNHTAEEECRCQTLQNFVVDCLTVNPIVDISEWRMQMDCPITCESPLIYQDCYQRRCEPTCESLSDPNICPKLPNVCFPGCYCPPGFVKKKDTCIKPSECRDCECNVLPHLQYVTYDENNFTINGNCVYVMSRDQLIQEQQHKFQVLITNAPCRKNQAKTCVGKVTCLYQGHKIHILNDEFKRRLKMIVDGERITDYSEVPFLKVTETKTKHLKVFLKDVMVEVSVYYPSLGVSVKAPSHKYGGKLEGLCGDCNKEPADDIRTPSGAKLDDVNEFGLSWLYEHLPGGQSREQCENKPRDECEPFPADQDPCLNTILDPNKFGQCLRVLDPTLFIEWCQKDTCGGHPELSCPAIEAYAKDCASAGFCINWRSDICPAETCTDGKIYNPCGTSCPATCDSIKTKQKSCPPIPVEGCYCPEGKVLLNSTCVEAKDCEVCDDEGHHPGDVWKRDDCTSCRCDGTGLKCETQHCSQSKICERGYQSLRIPAGPGQCCDEFMCVPEPTMGPTCETPQKLVCAPDQIMKLDTKPNGCQQFICECKPKDECDSLDLTTDTPLQDGYTKEIDESGCCPKINLICKPELCAEPQECPQYHTLKNVTSPGKCCPLFTCEPPKDKCIYENSYAPNESGGERERTNFEKQKVLQNGNETWKDGPCRECKCSLSEIGNYQPSCTKTDCAKIETNPDFLEYKLEPDYVYNECCPKTKRVACKFNNKLYQVGDEWTKGEDYCTTFECVNGTTGVQKETRVKSCDSKCDLGSEYVPPNKEAKECCGSCKPVACVVDGVVHKIGEEWHSSDHCTNYFCLNINGSMQVQSVLVKCPEMPKDYVDNYVFESIPIEGECCKDYITTACKANGEIYGVGETWASPDKDPCKKITCVENDRKEITKKELVQSCKKDCNLGWEFKESNVSCCGECYQIGCVFDNKVKLAGDSWKNGDNCTTYSCDVVEDLLVVNRQQEACPDLEDCPEENTYVKGCCKVCNITSMSQTLCNPSPLPETKTTGIIKTYRQSHGTCLNKKPIANFTECVGNCQSSTYFDLQSGSHESSCTCCQATKYTSIEVELECEDGHVWRKKVAVPSKCGCEGCAAAAAAQAYTKSPTKSFVKS